MKKALLLLIIQSALVAGVYSGISDKYGVNADPDELKSTVVQTLMNHLCTMDTNAVVAYQFTREYCQNEAIWFKNMFYLEGVVATLGLFNEIRKEDWAFEGWIVAGLFSGLLYMVFFFFGKIIAMA